MTSFPTPSPARADLAALVVHDLKNALGVLEAQLDRLRLEPDPERSGAGAAHRACAELRRRFVAFLMLYGSLGAIRAVPADESPQQMLEALAALPRPQGAAEVRIGEGADAPPYWFFDARLVRMALESALHNAWRFARREVVVGARLDPSGHLVFEVDDDGPGPGAGDACTSATGLGLSLCLAIAEAHACGGRAGRVTLAERPGGGARFELWIA